MKDGVILLTLFYRSYHSLVCDLYFDSGYFTEDGRVCVTLFRLTLYRHVSHVILLLLSERHNHLHLTCENRKKYVKYKSIQSGLSPIMLIRISLFLLHISTHNNGRDFQKKNLNILELGFVHSLKLLRCHFGIPAGGQCQKLRKIQ